MTRKEAAEKVAKLRRLAEDQRTPKTEAASARRQADKLAKEHGLTGAELEQGRRAAAFDDLVGQVEGLVDKHRESTAGLFGAEASVREALKKIREWKDGDKSARLSQIVMVVRTAAFFAGEHPMVAEVKAVVDSVLKNHDVRI